MNWPNFEYAPLKPDAWMKNRVTGGRTAVYTMRTWYREHGQNVFKDIVQAHPEDLQEGPRPSDGT